MLLGPLCVLLLPAEPLFPVHPAGSLVCPVGQARPRPMSPWSLCVSVQGQKATSEGFQQQEFLSHVWRPEDQAVGWASLCPEAPGKGPSCLSPCWSPRQSWAHGHCTPTSTSISAPPVPAGPLSRNIGPRDYPGCFCLGIINHICKDPISKEHLQVLGTRTRSLWGI